MRHPPPQPIPNDPSVEEALRSGFDLLEDTAGRLAGALERARYVLVRIAAMECRPWPGSALDPSMISSLARRQLVASAISLEGSADRVVQLAQRWSDAAWAVAAAARVLAAQRAADGQSSSTGDADVAVF